MPNSLKQFSLFNKTALVTGSCQGLGLSMAEGLARAGATVFINGRNPETVKSTCCKSEYQSINFVPLPFDIEVPDERIRALKVIEEGYGGLDILVNNAGIRNRKGMFDLTTHDFNQLLNNHVVAAFDLVKAAAEQMIAKNSGSIINIISLSAFIANNQDTAYSAAKGALLSLTRAQAAELGPFGIRVNAIAPGPFNTETNRVVAESKQGQERVKQRNSLGRWGESKEISGTAIFLASEASSFMTGQVIVIDGGFLSHY